MTLTIAHKYLRELLNNLSEDNLDDFLLELQFSSGNRQFWIPRC